MKRVSIIRCLSLAVVAAALTACVETNPKEPANNMPAPPPAAPADPSLIHRYSFTNDAKDSVGHIDGAIKNTAKVTGGKLVLQGDAITSGEATTIPYLEFSGPILPTSGSASIAIWFTCSPKTGTFAPRLLDLGDSVPGNNGNVGNAFLYFTPNFTSTNNARAKISATDSSAGTPLDTAPNLDDGQPHLVIIALDASQMHVFVDGREPTPAVALGGNTLASLKPVHNWIGRSGFDQDHGVNASVDEIRTYNRTLTLADAAALEKAGPDKLP